MTMYVNLVAIPATQLESLLDDPSSIVDFLFPDGEEAEHARAVDVGADWQALHFLLTGELRGGPSPLADAVFGGKEVRHRTIDPVAYQQPIDVARVSAALEQVTEEQIRSRFPALRRRGSRVYKYEGVQSQHNADQAAIFISPSICS